MHGNKKKTKSVRKTELVKHITTAFELPKEITLNLPIISLIGNDELTIENYKGIVEYTEDKIRASTSSGILKIEGKSLVIKHITSESIAINGKIRNIEFVY